MLTNDAGSKSCPLPLILNNISFCVDERNSNHLSLLRLSFASDSSNTLFAFIRLFLLFLRERVVVHDHENVLF